MLFRNNAMQDCKSYLAIAKDVSFDVQIKRCHLPVRLSVIYWTNVKQFWHKAFLEGEGNSKYLHTPFFHMQCREIMTILNHSVFIIRDILQVDYCLKMVFVWAIWHMGLLLYKYCFSLILFRLKKDTFISSIKYHQCRMKWFFQNNMKYLCVQKAEIRSADTIKNN